MMLFSVLNVIHVHKKRNSFTVSYRSNGETLFGEIEYFICVPVDQSFEVYACFTTYTKEQ